MKIIRDEDRIRKLKKRSNQASLIGFLFLAGGFILVFLKVPNLILFQTLALVIGYSVSQYGIFLAHRYARQTRPDEILDSAVKTVAREGRMYHFVLPAPHVLLTKAGPIVFVLKYQVGKIWAQDEKWKQTGIGFRRFFGQEGLGNPSREAESMIKGLAGYISNHAPQLNEVPIAAMIVFTTKNIDELDVAGSSIPAMHHTKVKGFLRQKGQGTTLPAADYAALQEAFDKAAVDLL